MTKDIVRDTAPSNGHTDTVPFSTDLSASQRDRFSDLSKLKMSQDFVSAVAVKKAIRTIAVRKPHAHEFVRVWPGDEWRLQTGCFTHKGTKEIYLVAPELWNLFPKQITPTLLVTCITRNTDVPFLWPLTLPKADARASSWHDSALEAAQLAQTEWVRLESDMEASCYVINVATANLPEPAMPSLTFEEMLRLAFKKDRFVEDTDHVIWQQLRGEV